MNRYLLFCLSLLYGISSEAQPTTFHKYIGSNRQDAGGCMATTQDKGFILAGATDTSAGGFDGEVYLIRTDSSMNIVWSRYYADAGNDNVTAVIETPDHGFVLCGSSSIQSGQDIFHSGFIIRTDSLGNVLWNKDLVTIAPDSGAYMLNAMVAAENGSFIVAGGTDHLGAGFLDVYLMKMDLSGNVIWTKTIGGPQMEYANALSRGSDGSLLIGGNIHSFMPAGTEGFLMKTDSTGTPIWSKGYDAAGDQQILDVCHTADGGAAVTGNMWAGLSGNSANTHMIRTDSMGNLQWARIYIGNSTNGGIRVSQTKDSSFMLLAVVTIDVSTSDNDLALIKTDTAGEVRWSANYGTVDQEYGRELIEMNDGYLIAGGTILPSGFGDMYYIRTDSIGSSGCHEGPYNFIDAPLLLTVINLTADTGSGYSIVNKASYTGTGAQLTVLCSTDAVNDHYGPGHSSRITISPNPATTAITVGHTEAGWLFITNMEGKCLLQTYLINSPATAVKLPPLSSGLYFYRFRSDRGSVTSGKLAID